MLTVLAFSVVAYLLWLHAEAVDDAIVNEQAAREAAFLRSQVLMNRYVIELCGSIVIDALECEAERLAAGDFLGAAYWAEDAERQSRIAFAEAVRA